MSSEPQSAPSVQVDDVAPWVVQLSLCDARRKNAMSPELGDALAAAIAGLAPRCARGEVRAVVLTGAGDAFSAGGDLAMLEQLRAASFMERYDFMLGFYRRYLSLLDLPVPVIAAVRGAAIGAGLAVAAACDLLVVADDAKLAVNFVALGLHPGMGSTYLLPRRVGAQCAADLLYTGRRFDGREAAARGLALRSLPDAEVLTHARELATQIARSGPLAVRRTKESLALDRAALQQALEREAFAQAESYGSDELGEGLAAARARRAPSWSQP